MSKVPQPQAQALADAKQWELSAFVAALNDHPGFLISFKDNDDVVRYWTAVQGQSKQEDRSEQLSLHLVRPALNNPPDIEQLEEYLATPPDASVPISADALYTIRDYPISQHFVAAHGSLAQAVSAAVWTAPIIGSSEHFTVIAEQSCVVSILQALDHALGIHRIGLVLERDQGDTTSLMTVLSPSGHPLRPDGVLRDADGFRLLAKWEDKGALHSMDDAVQDLQSKTGQWTRLYYGDIKYLPCFAACGTKLRFYAIDRQHVTDPVPISPTLDMSLATERARLVLYAVKFYKLLMAQQKLYPKFVLRAAQDLIASSHGFKRTLYFKLNSLTVLKRLEPWSRYAEVTGVSHADLAQVYVATSTAQGVVHCVPPGPQLVDDKYTAELFPVGMQYRDAKPGTEDDLRCAAHGLLHGLAAVHKAGYVSRDLRWENSASSLDRKRWFLLDLETCTKEGQDPGSFRAVCWDMHVLVGGRYTYASDLYLLGRMLLQHAGVVSSAQGLAFLDAITKGASSQDTTAQGFLDHEWLQCEGEPICRLAGAQPGE